MRSAFLIFNSKTSALKLVRAGLRCIKTRVSGSNCVIQELRRHGWMIADSRTFSCFCSLQNIVPHVFDELTAHYFTIELLLRRILIMGATVI